MNEIENKIKELFSNIIDNQVYGNVININENILNYGINSLGFIKFIVSIESEFNIEFNDEDLDIKKFQNIESIIHFVESKVNQTHGCSAKSL